MDHSVISTQVQASYLGCVSEYLRVDNFNEIAKIIKTRRNTNQSEPANDKMKMSFVKLSLSGLYISTCLKKYRFL